ncbi:MAG: glutamate synthase large subunit [Alphaproteobacteria bacterium]
MSNDYVEELLFKQLNNKELLSKYGLYNQKDEHSSCGVGFISSIDGKASRKVVKVGIESLKALFYRGAVDADGKTGDGAGIHIELPQEFFKEHIRNTGHAAKKDLVAVGMIFLPRKDLHARERCRAIVESEIIDFGYEVYGWRQVPVDTSVIGEKANATRPEIEQIMIANSKNKTAEDFDLDLYIIRRKIENAVIAEHIKDFYICSFSCRTIIYKGLFLAGQLAQFFPDLQDERFISRYALYHQRYSTNTFPTWSLAQPFRMIAHNGEINTLSGNLNWLKALEPRLESKRIGEYIKDVKPIVLPDSSDSAALDSVFELMCYSGRDIPLVKSILIPEAIENKKDAKEELKAFVSYCNSIITPWDGPAALVATDGKWILAGMDRNGLRPLRYTVMEDGLLIVGSESGMIRVKETDIIEKGKILPGEMLALNLDEGKLYKDAEIKAKLAAKHPYSDWVKRITKLEDIIREKTLDKPSVKEESLTKLQNCFGITKEDIKTVLTPMICDGKEAVGSMGDDVPLAVLAEGYRSLHHYFRQIFSQVTNPPIDSLREVSVMSLATRIGNMGNILDETERQCDILEMASPVLLNREFDTMVDFLKDKIYQIDCTFDVEGGKDSLFHRVEEIKKEAVSAVLSGKSNIVLSDRNISEKRAPMPMILATGAVHTELIKQKLRAESTIHVASGECIDTHYFAVLIGVGATTVNPYLTQDAIVISHKKDNLYGELSLEECLQNYKKAINAGLLKIMSKVGICIISSYRGGGYFEALGLSRTMVARCFLGMSSRISGIGTEGLRQMIVKQHKKAFVEGADLDAGGFYFDRKNSKTPHGFSMLIAKKLQEAVRTDSYTAYKDYVEEIEKLPPIDLRNLLGFKYAKEPMPRDEVQSITEIRKSFLTPGMSYGALSPEAHETLNIAMNRIGAKSVSGEGGEDSNRYKPYSNGDNANSAVKQVASGRFGVTAEYLNNCVEIEIKMAQGAKPGEGGQLLGIKVTEEIAKLRNAVKGTTLISPPPHHDIYSIEDLAQLIYDLKQINPKAKVGVKLVSKSGVGTIAAGVAKAKADIITISGNNGGTGATPLTSMKFAGAPWELGLAETNQILVLNNLRHNVKLRVDGGIKTGKDIVIAAILGAEEFGIGTASLISLGCVADRMCHKNTCPVGICTQNPDLRKRYKGTPDNVVNLFSFIAEDVRTILAQLGVRSLKELIGRTDLLYQINRGAENLDDLDLNPILVKPDIGDAKMYCTVEGRNEVPETLDELIIKDAEPVLENKAKMQLTYNVRNTHRSVGAKISHMIYKKYGNSLSNDLLTIRLRGSAGQSLGAFAVNGLKLEVFGDANDYVGKGLSGGIIVVRPSASSKLKTNENIIIGNTVLYGATSGKLFAAGKAGERFAVRNSGAAAVVEGCGYNGCEYMTGGVVVILGDVGYNFGAGMTGGLAFIYSPYDISDKINKDSITLEKIRDPKHEMILKDLIKEHIKETKSSFASSLLDNWEKEKDNFKIAVH